MSIHDDDIAVGMRATIVLTPVVGGLRLTGLDRRPATVTRVERMSDVEPSRLALEGTGALDRVVRITVRDETLPESESREGGWPMRFQRVHGFVVGVWFLDEDDLPADYIEGRLELADATGGAR